MQVCLYYAGFIMPQNEITGSHGRCIFSLEGHFHTVLHNSCTNFPTNNECEFFSHQQLLLFFPFNFWPVTWGSFWFAFFSLILLMLIIFWWLKNSSGIKTLLFCIICSVQCLLWRLILPTRLTVYSQCFYDDTYIL
jgi:hypothetical protein